MLESFFKSFINSVIMSFFIALAGLSFYVGNFPPTIAQVKKVYADYKALLKMKEKMLEGNPQGSPMDLVATLEKAKAEQVKRLAEARGNVHPADSVEQTIPGQNPNLQVASVPDRVVAAAPAPVQKMVIPNEWQEQFYSLRAEVLRLNQRITELEKRKSR